MTKKQEVAPATTVTEDPARQFASRCRELNNEVFLAIAEHRTGDAIETAKRVVLCLGEWRMAEQGIQPTPDVSLEEVGRNLLRGLR